MIFSDHAVGPVLWGTKHTLSNIFSWCPMEFPVCTEQWHKQKGQMKHNRHICLVSNINACNLPPSHFIISLVFPPHLLWAFVESTGEISVCGRACLSSTGSRGWLRDFERWGNDWEGKENSHFAALVCCLWRALFPFVCLAITYSAQGNSSRGWAQASVKTENNEATAAQRMAFSLCLGHPHHSFPS